ncbi:MAG: HEPN domain-containing protein [Candidatus Sumerlaeota bacterium]|nr:HEPN domain-containing protein [Candidatus Sumerlaeota bacterium]
MRPPEEVKRRFVRQWISKAEADLGMARSLLSGPTEFAFGSAFHAQQAAEKAIKALLVWLEREFPKTHDIRKLIELVDWPEGQPPAPLQKAIRLSIFASEYRYPGDLPDLTLAEARQALEWAEDVKAEVQRRIPREFSKQE